MRQRESGKIKHCVCKKQIVCYYLSISNIKLHTVSNRPYNKGSLHVRSKKVVYKWLWSVDQFHFGIVQSLLSKPGQIEFFLYYKLHSR